MDLGFGHERALAYSWDLSFVPAVPSRRPRVSTFPRIESAAQLPAALGLPAV